MVNLEPHVKEENKGLRDIYKNKSTARLLCGTVRVFANNDYVIRAVT